MPTYKNSLSLSHTHTTHSYALYHASLLSLWQRIQCYLWCLIHSSTGILEGSWHKLNISTWCAGVQGPDLPYHKSKWRVLCDNSSVRSGNGTWDCGRHLFYVLNPSIKLSLLLSPLPLPSTAITAATSVITKEVFLFVEPTAASVWCIETLAFR